MTAAARDELALVLVERPDAWEACRATLPGASVFHRWDWCALAAAGLGLAFLPLGVRVGDRLVGLAPVLLRRRGPIAAVNWVPFPYLGPLLPPGLAPGALAQLRRELRRRRAVVTQLGFGPAAAVGPAELRGAGYEPLRDRTAVVPLAGREEADLWRAMQGNARRNVQRGQRLGLRVRPATRAEVVDVLPALVSGAYARSGGASDYSGAMLRRFWEAFGGRGDVRMATLDDAGEPVAVGIALADGETAYQWLLAARRRPGLDTSCQLYWDAFRWARERGCAAFDLVGTPTPGVEAYKRRLGGEPREHLVARRFEPGFARRALALHGRLRTELARRRAPALSARLGAARTATTRG
jgi:Acetyltransferase (GNAT) domain